MKKFLFWTALASVALTGCVKNDVEPNPSLGQDVEITFNAPVIGKITKAHIGEIEDATYPTTEQFIVHAWAHEGNFNPDASPAHAVYINQQVTTYFDGSSIAAGPGEDYGNRTWHITPDPYYWPKTHKLTFTAYSPKEMKTYASIDVKTGIKLTDVVINSDASVHRDILYSNRVYNQTYPDYKYDAANDTVIGVDILFHHALASVKVMVKVKDDYTSIDEDQITIHKIWFDNVEMKGTFTEGLFTGLETSSTGSWSEPLTETSEVDLKGDNNEVIDGVTTEKQYGCTALLIPQDLDGNLNVNYTIKNPDGVYIDETITFKLSEQTSGLTPIDKWEQSKRYTYTLTFGLNEIYLAPRVDEWTPVTMSNINI